MAGGGADEVGNGVALEDEIVGAISPLFNWVHRIASVVVILVHHQHAVTESILEICNNMRSTKVMSSTMHYLTGREIKKREQRLHNVERTVELIVG